MVMIRRLLLMGILALGLSTTAHAERMILQNQATAAYRTLQFKCVDNDTNLPATVSKAGQQPLLLLDDGSTVGSTGIGTLTTVTSHPELYNAILTQAITNSVGRHIVAFFNDVDVTCASADVQIISLDYASTGFGLTLSAIGANVITAAATATDFSTEINTGMATSTAVSTLQSDLTLVKTKTDFLPSATAGAAGGVFIAGTNAATTVNITGSLSGNVGGIAGTITTLDTLKTSVISTLLATTLSELSQATPPSTPTVAQALMAPYMAIVNEITVTSGLKTFSNGVGTVIFKKSLSDDDTTFVEEAATAGP